MTRTTTTVTVAAAAVATALALVMSQHRGEAAADAALDHAAHAAMTPLEHIAHLSANGDIHAGHYLMEMKWEARQAAPANSALPADDMGAQARLAASPRKGEYVTIDVNGSPMRTWVVHPAGTGPAPVVVVIQEVFGLADWIRGVADQLAAEGFLAVAPDLLAGQGPNGGDSTAFANQQEMVKATVSLPAPLLAARLKAAREWGLKHPRSNGKSASVGFCFGGTQSFTMAVNEPGLNASVVYYGTAPAEAGGAQGAFVPSEGLTRINAAVLGLYGGLAEDARIGATLDATEAKMKASGKTYEKRVFEGAAHGFLRAQTGNNGANMKASQAAWPLTVAWIKKHAS